MRTQLKEQWMAKLEGAIGGMAAQPRGLKLIHGGLWTLDKGSLSRMSQCSTEGAVVVSYSYAPGSDVSLY